MPDLGVGRAGARLTAAFGGATIVIFVVGFVGIMWAVLLGGWTYDPRVGQFYLAAATAPALVFFANRLPEILRLINEFKHGPQELRAECERLRALVVSLGGTP